MGEKAKSKLKNRRGGAWDPRCLQQVQIASLIGVSAPAIVGWCKKGCPRNADEKTYSLGDVVKWIMRGAVDMRHLPQSEMLKVLATTKPTIGEWQKRGMPRNKDGSYDAAACVVWRFREMEMRISDSRKLSDLDLERIRRNRLASESAELDLGERRGELLPRGAVVAGWVARYQTLKAMLVAMIGRLHGQGFNGDQVRLVRDEIYASLERLARGPDLYMEPALAAEVEAICKRLAPDKNEPLNLPEPPPAADLTRNEEWYG